MGLSMFLSKCLSTGLHMGLPMVLLMTSSSGSFTGGRVACAFGMASSYGVWGG